MLPIDKLICSKRKTLSLIVERDGTLLVRFQPEGLRERLTMDRRRPRRRAKPL